MPRILIEIIIDNRVYGEKTWPVVPHVGDKILLNNKKVCRVNEAVYSDDAKGQYDCWVQLFAEFTEDAIK